MSDASLPKKHTGRWLPVVFSGLILGCTGNIGEVGSNGGITPPDGEISCTEGPTAARSPLRRLTRAEYRATMRDLLGIPAPELSDFVPDETRAGFDLNVSAPSLLSVEKLRASAEAFAVTARQGLEDTCDVSDTACATEILSDFGLRAYRRPLDASEIAGYVELYETERDASDATVALELALQTILSSPHFLYHVEIGRPEAASENGVAPLTGYEVASRLSYFLWGTLPDETLFAEAGAGALDTPEGIEAAARRMLQDPKAAEMLGEFSRQWLDLRAVDDVERDGEMFPEWSPELLTSMRTETQTFLEEVVLRGDAKLETLLTAPYSYVDGPLADHYGVDAEGDFEKTALPATERAGLLTQGLVLVTHAYPAANSWVHRGKFIRERMLCSPLPPPPPDVDFSNTNDPNRLTNPECSGCHLMMDPIGKAFDSYDPTGRFATLDALGAPIDGSGEVFASTIGKFDSIVELAGDLAADPMVHACFADTWSSYALGRSLEADPCAEASILEAFDASGHDLRELFVAIAKSDAFRFTKAD